ncbi:thioredoxin-like protein [Glomus cerebriforme]|uniref:Thioredoxin-like protein n=1 Tax=Glomus cerebriforme TaxID=658196 RepID=A0A397TG07_9GLOM|nr:thioredoxin-like protein [Glomus cerebriforme]
MSEETKERVQIYGSSVAGNIFVKSNQSWIEQVLKQHGIKFSFVDVAADEDAKKYMKRKNRGETELPQIFVDGEYKGIFKTFQEAVEMKEVKKFLGLESN